MIKIYTKTGELFTTEELVMGKGRIKFRDHNTGDIELPTLKLLKIEDPIYKLKLRIIR